MVQGNKSLVELPTWGCCISEALKNLYITNKQRAGPWSSLGLEGEVPEFLLGVSFLEVYVSVRSPIGLLYRMEPLKQKGVAFQISEDLQTLYITTNKRATK